MNNDSYDVAMLSMYIGRPLLSQRLEDVLAALNVLAARGEVDYDAIDLTGVGRACPVALYAAALDDRISHVTVSNSMMSWIEDVVANPREPNLIDHVVPGVLLYYDLPDLVALLADKVTFRSGSA